MSETTTAPAEAGSGDLPVPFAVFARSLGPRRETTRDSRGRSRVRVVPGHPDEVYARLLRARHGNERHTAAEWQALIDRFRSELAHWADLRYKGARP